MKKLFCLILPLALTLISFSQKRLGMMEYVTNATIGLQTTGKEAMNGTGFFFVFKTAKGLVPTIITSKHLLANAQTVTFSFLEQNAQGIPQYDKQQPVTINKTELTVINHPEAGVDLAVIPIASILNYYSKKNILISYHPLSEEAILNDSVARTLTPVEDVILVGHPGGLKKELNSIPLTKTGITATPVFLDHNRQKEFLVTFRSYDGACGSPVFIYQNGKFDRSDVRMDGQRMLLAGINCETYERGFKDRVYPDETKSLLQEDVSIVIKAERIKAFKPLVGF